MVTTKHCCYGDCKSDSRTLNNNEIFFIGFGNGFPKPKVSREKCMRWVQNCGRKYFTIANVNKDTYICSLHFVGGKGPTEENHDPVKCGIEVTRKRKRPAERLPYKSPKQQRIERNEAAQAILMLPLTGIDSPDVCETAQETAPNNPTTKLFTSTGTNCKPDIQEKECQTETPLTADVVRLKIQNRILENNIRVSSQDQFLIKKPNKKRTVETKNAKQAGHFSVDNFMNDDKAFRFYTGLTYIQFLCLWNFLGNCAKKLTFWNSGVTNPDKTPSRRPGRKRHISPQDQLFMLLVRVRLGLLNQDLAYRFQTNTRQISSTVITWIQLLYKQFSMLKKSMFASRRTVRKHLPKCFKKYKNIRCIIDCTEVHVQSPGNFQAQGNQYSSYKGYTSYKFLVAVAPNGAILYVSDAFEGSISDKEIVKQSDFLEFLEPGDVIMADRGFLIADMLNERQVKMIRPPFLGLRHQFTPQEEALTKDIAKHRIHVERSIERIKKFKILQRIIPRSLQPVFSQLVFVVACLVNFQEPLVK